MKHIKKILIISIILCVSLSTNVFAAWWGTPGYEWALTTGLTGVRTKAQLDRDVELNDLYATIINYLSMKGIRARERNIHHEDKLNELDNVARGIVDIINEKNAKEKLTIQDFYVVENYCKKGYDLLEKYRSYSQYLTREQLQNLEAYLKLSKYKAATLIEKRSDREYALSRVGWVRNSKIINYGMMPYAEKISRKEFLLVIFDLLSESASTWSDDAKLKSLEDANVLIGYDIGLELDKNINYTEMYAFLYRLETYDFETLSQKNALSDLEAYIERAIENNISKAELINYFNDIYYSTDSQVDLLARVESEVGSSWTVREAGECLSQIYKTSGFSYKDGSVVVKVGGSR